MKDYCSDYCNLIELDSREMQMDHSVGSVVPVDPLHLEKGKVEVTKMELLLLPEQFILENGNKRIE